MWVLLLNDMRHSKFEDLSPVCRGDSLIDLLALIRVEKVETYKEPKGGDGSFWGKSFRKDGPLEWFNAPMASQLHKHLVEVDPDTIIDHWSHMAARALPHAVVGMLSERSIDEVLDLFRGHRRDDADRTP